MIVGTIISILTIIAYWKVLTKANEEGWKSLIPIYNVYIMFKIAKNDGFFKYLGSFIGAFVLMMIASASTSIPEVIIGILGIVAFILYLYTFIILYKMYADLAECFGKERIFALGLLFLAPIFMMILAFGDATYCETVDNPSNDVIDAYSDENKNEYSETTMFSENSQEEE